MDFKDSGEEEEEYFFVLVFDHQTLRVLPNWIDLFFLFL
jgi:hypothetical protein